MRGVQAAERSLMAGGMSAEAAAIAREAQMRSEASEAARIAYVTQARTLRERRGSFIKMVVVSALVAAICSRLRGTVGALGFSISTGLMIWGVVDAVMLTSQIKVLDKRAMDMMRARDAAAKIAAEAQELQRRQTRWEGLKMAQDMQDAGNVSAELDAMVCDLIGAFLDDLAAGENPGVVVAIEDAASNRYLAALDEDGEEACLEAATNFISEHKMGLKDEGLGRIARYAIGYTGCVEIDGGYHDALLVSFFETTLESGFSAYVLYEGMGAGDGFMWSDPEPAGEETPLI